MRVSVTLQATGKAFRYLLRVGSTVAFLTGWHISMVVGMAQYTFQLPMIYPATCYAGTGVGMTVGTKRFKSLEFQAGERRMGHDMTTLTGRHPLTLSMRGLVASNAGWQDILIFQPTAETVKRFMTFPALEAMRSLAVFDGHEDFIMAAGAVDGRHLPAHLLHILTVGVALSCSDS